MFLHPDRREKLPTLTHKKLLKMVSYHSQALPMYHSFRLMHWFYNGFLPPLKFRQLHQYPNLQGHCNLHLHLVNMHIFIGRTLHPCLERRLIVCLCHPGVTTLCNLSECHKRLKVLFILNSTMILFFKFQFQFFSPLSDWKLINVDIPKILLALKIYLLLDDMGRAGQAVPLNCSYSSNNENIPGAWTESQGIDQVDQGKPKKGYYAPLCPNLRILYLILV